MKNKIAIVTGGNSGIGEGIVTSFLRQGAKVAVFCHNEADFAAMQERHSENKDQMMGVGIDTSKKEDWDSAVKQVIEKWGTVDILVNNAGILIMKDVAELSVDEFHDVIHVNLLGYFYGMKQVIPIMKEKKYGRIINVASIAGLKGWAQLSAYCASKFGVIGLTKSSAIDLAPHGITVNAICPGLIETDMTKGMLSDPAMKQGLMQGIPVGRAGQPEDIARVAVYLAESGASFVTGTTNVVDGGNIA
ncbi:SDR family oxidoreductase, partial [Patescibacteria group bacterium]|nr:SDR family oxidoreductase [Patescibacteria group bacterium]